MHPLFFFSFVFIVSFFLPAVAQAEDARFALQSDLDHVWTMTAAGMVFLMQGGFLLLEAGLVRSKNSINVAQKNIADFVVTVVIFGFVGFMFMFGSSMGGFIGFDTSLMNFKALDEAWTYTFFVFHQRKLLYQSPLVCSVEYQ